MGPTTISRSTPESMHVLLLAPAFLALVQPAEAKHHWRQAAKVEFQPSEPCPATGRTKGKCCGYVIDHVMPLACGGAESPSNMQWQTQADTKPKDEWERKACGK